MIFKVFLRAEKLSQQDKNRYDRYIICKVIAVENGQQLEKRIDNVISNLKADGYDVAEVVDCFNISEPTESRNQQIDRYENN